MIARIIIIVNIHCNWYLDSLKSWLFTTKKSHLQSNFEDEINVSQITFWTMSRACSHVKQSIIIEKEIFKNTAWKLPELSNYQINICALALRLRYRFACHLLVVFTQFSPDSLSVPPSVCLVSDVDLCVCMLYINKTCFNCTEGE